jgi:hypothetical protein|tara:strand:+ start:123 stop:605 length:483 start_codon:yes stop_codon:yes gene_type:complete
MEIIENYLSDRVFNHLKELILSTNFSWYFMGKVAYLHENGDDFYFNHKFYEDKEQCSELFQDIVHPIIGSLNFNYLIRARANLYTRKEERVQNDFHIDQPEKHKVALFSVNTCNGYTLFKDGTKYYSKENSICIFDGQLEHASVSQTDTKRRVNININYI